MAKPTPNGIGHGPPIPPLARKLAQRANRVRSRGETYLPQPQVRVYRLKDGRIHAHFTQVIALCGLLWSLLGRSFGGSFLPILPVKNDLRNRDGKTDRLPEGFVLKAARSGFFAVKAKWLISMELLGLVAETFPRAVDARAYSGGLCAALLGGGFFRNIPALLTEVKSYRMEDYNLEGTTQTIKVRVECPAGSDGSGRIHPKHSIYTSLGIRPEDACPIQIRVWKPGWDRVVALLTKIGLSHLVESLTLAGSDGWNWLFAKGILVPDERCKTADGSPDLWLDWSQVKGVKKADAKTAKKAGQSVRTQINLGVIQKWDRPGTISWCFEILERVENSPRNQEIVSSFLQEAIDTLKKKGIEGLIEKEAKKDPQVAVAWAIAKKLGINPLAIPFLRERVEDSLGYMLWHLNQGAGKEAHRYEAVIDNGLRPGTCVIRPFKDENGQWRGKVGTELAVTRFPMVLAQGLTTLKVVKPSDHHLIQDGKGGNHVPCFTIYLHEEDIVKRMMGDDDGDPIMVDGDPRVVEMFKTRISFGPPAEDILLIEPHHHEDDKLGQIPTKSKEGLQVMAVDAGNSLTGLGTAYMSMFLALGMVGHARAMACVVQESIDAVKKIVRATNPNKAKDMANWEKKDGCWHLKDGMSAPEEILDPMTGLIDQERLMKWVSRATGGLKMNEVLSWKKGKTDGEEGGNSKKLSPLAWNPAEEGGNLVHHCSRVAHRLFGDWWAEQLPDEGKCIDLGSSLLKLMGREDITPLSLEEYRRGDGLSPGLLKKSGLREYGKAVHSIMERGLEPELRNQLIQAEAAELREQLQALSLDEVLTVWATEMAWAGSEDNGHQDGSMNRAFRAISWTGSPVLKLLEVQDSNCTFMSDQRLRATMKWLKQQTEGWTGQDGQYNPPTAVNLYSAMVLAMESSTKHEEECKNPNGEGIRLRDCPTCSKLIEGMVVSTTRKENSPHEGTALEEAKRLVTALNKAV